MRHPLCTLFLAVFLSASIFSCTSESSDDNNENPPVGSSGIYTIYSTGYQHYNRIAKQWHDGTDVTLLNRTSKVYLNDMAIASNGDVYVTGCECTWSRYPLSPNEKNDSCRITLWRNKIRQQLTQVLFSSLTSAYVFVTPGDDVYVAGTERLGSSGAGVIKLWKNGVVQNITDGTTDAVATSLHVNGNDVYIGGNQKPIGAINTTATLWKNGVAQPLSGTTSYFDEVTAIQVNGNDVYTAIQESGEGWVAKNGVRQPEPSGFQTIKDIFLSGADLYVLGKPTYTTTSVWKNAALLHNLNYTGISDYYDGGQSLYVKGDDVYVAGVTTTNGSDNPVIWKNANIINTLAQPGTSLTTAEAIIVK